MNRWTYWWGRRYWPKDMTSPISRWSACSTRTARCTAATSARLEKLYAQLAQVAGRAGRADKPGEVLIQTAFPDHPLFRALRAHDFDSWATSLLAERKSAGFPPFVYQAMLRAEGMSETDVDSFLQQGREAAVELAMQVEIYGVVPAAMPRRANHTRAQLLVQCESRKLLQHFLRAWKPALDALPARKLRWSLDIDPLEF